MVSLAASRRQAKVERIIQVAYLNPSKVGEGEIDGVTKSIPEEVLKRLVFRITKYPEAVWCRSIVRE